MKIFVDTGSIKDIETIAQLGILDGVTTNPSLLAKESGDYRQNLKKICEIVKGPVSVPDRFPLRRKPVSIQSRFLAKITSGYPGD